MRKVREVEIPPRIPDKSIYSEIHDRQASLVKLYVDKGKQPDFPVDMNSKENQNFMREIIGFLEEEIIEAYEILERITHEHHVLKPAQIKVLIEEYNEEQADAFHLFVEVLQYSNILDFDLGAYYVKYFTDTDQVHLINPDPLVMAFNHASTVDYLALLRTRSTFRVFEISDDLTTGGTKVGANSLDQSEKALFSVFKYMRKATNQLKNKYWKETETGVNIEKYHELIMESWLYYILYLKINGFTPESVRDTYIRKNEVNLDRIKHKY